MWTSPPAYLALFSKMLIYIKLNKDVIYKLTVRGPLNRGPLEIPMSQACGRRRARAAPRGASPPRPPWSPATIIYIYIYIYVYVYVHIYIYIYIMYDISLSLSLYIYIYIYIYLSLSLSLYIYIYIYIWGFVYTFANYTFTKPLISFIIVFFITGL